MQETMHPDIERILLNPPTIAGRVRELGQAITKDYAGKDLVLLAVLRGSVVFLADLMRAVHIPVMVDFMSVSSYGNSAESCGVVKIVKDCDVELTGRHVLVVEDILDTGGTLLHLKQLLKTRAPASVRTAVLLDKPSRRKVDIHVDYLGFEVPDEFLVGYGLDYAERYRNLPYVGALKRSVYESK